MSCILVTSKDHFGLQPEGRTISFSGHLSWNFDLLHGFLRLTKLNIGFEECFESFSFILLFNYYIFTDVPKKAT